MAIRKHRKDTDVNIFCLQHLIKVKEAGGEGQGRDAVALTALRPITHQDIHSSKVVGKITGDASKMGWSVLNPMMREAMAVHMPKPMQEAISKAGLLPQDHPLRLFIMAIAELAVCPMGQFQWGHTLRSKHFPLVLFATDNQNACAWLGSMFANNKLAQDICRLITANCFTDEHTVRSLWWPTYVNTLADLVSRMLDSDGVPIPKVREEFEMENAKLEESYRILRADELHPRIGELVQWMGGLNHAFSVLQGIPLRSDLCSAKGGDALDERRQSVARQLTQRGIRSAMRDRADPRKHTGRTLGDCESISLARAGTSGHRVSFPSTVSNCGYESRIGCQWASTVVTGKFDYEDFDYNAAEEWKVPPHDPSATLIHCEDEFPDGTQKYRRRSRRGRVHMSPAQRLPRDVRALTEARLRAKANSRAVEESAQQDQDMESVCTGDTDVHVQYKHGFVLISGLRDTSLQPVCYRKQCKMEGERWLRSAGLTHGQRVGAINSVCTVLPPLPDGKE